MTSKSSDYKVGDSDQRPWGTYIVTDVGIINDNENFCEKEITVKSGKILSLQSHKLRRELWIVKKGTLTVICDDKRITLKSGESVNIAIKTIHCMANLNNEECIVYERQEGICREDDIIRYIDAYGRATETNDSTAKSSINIYTQILNEIQKATT